MKKELAKNSSGSSVESDASENSPKTSRLATWFTSIDPLRIQALTSYLDEIRKFNRAVNLISTATEKNADSVHIADAVLAAQLILSELVPGAPLYDVGSGNGIPGIVFGIMDPSLKVVLIDRDQRKLEFCKHVIATLGLSNVSVRVTAVEDLPEGSVLNMVARGFAPLSKSLLLTRKQIPKGGRFFHLKSDAWTNELAQMPSQVFSHWSPRVLGTYRIPDSSAEVYIVVTDKTSD